MRARTRFRHVSIRPRFTLILANAAIHNRAQERDSSGLSYSFSEMPFVVSVTVILVKTTVIGGAQSGWMVAVTESEKSALPF